MKGYIEYHLVRELGLAQTRAASLADAMDSLHSSIGQMDSAHLKAMWRWMPGVMEAVAEYADHNPGLNNYRNWRQPS